MTTASAVIDVFLCAYQLRLSLWKSIVELNEITFKEIRSNVLYQV